jgi:hypothetical protein
VEENLSLGSKMSTEQNMARVQWWNLLLQNIAIIIAGIWVIYTYFYQEFIRGYFEKLVVNTNITLNTDGKGKVFSSGEEAIMVNLEVSLENPGKKTALIPGVHITVTGSNVDKDVNRDFLDRGPMIADYSQYGSHYGYKYSVKDYYYGDGSQAKPLARFLIPSWQLEPGEKLTRKFQILLPKDHHDIIAAQMFVLVKQPSFTEIINPEYDDYQVEWVLKGSRREDGIICEVTTCLSVFRLDIKEDNTYERKYIGQSYPKFYHYISGVTMFLLQDVEQKKINVN